jgi:hypothetical protein
MTDPIPVELMPEDAWNQFRRACGVGCAPVSDAIDWFTDMYDLPAARDPLVFDDEMMGRRLLDLEADLRHTRGQYFDVRQHVADLDAQLADLRGARILSVVFGHHKGAPRPFALYRKNDATGISGTGIVAEGAAFSDGTAVLRWLTEWPTSVVFHDRGIEAIEKIHGHGGATEIVWLSDELESLAVMEQQRDEARARLAAAQPVIDAARIQVAVWRRGKTSPDTITGLAHLVMYQAALAAAVDVLDAQPDPETNHG